MSRAISSTIAIDMAAKMTITIVIIIMAITTPSMCICVLVCVCVCDWSPALGLRSDTLQTGLGGELELRFPP